VKELEIEIRVRNNRLRERRTRLGYNQAEMAMVLGISLMRYARLENLRESPVGPTGEWRSTALKLAEYFDVEPEVLWPPHVIGIKVPSATRKIDMEDLGRLLVSESTLRASLPPVRDDEVAMVVNGAVTKETLSEREWIVVRERFGLDGPSATLGELAERFDRSREAIAMTERKALRRLRRILRQADPSVGALHSVTLVEKEEARRKAEENAKAAEAAEREAERKAEEAQHKYRPVVVFTAFLKGNSITIATTASVPLVHSLDEVSFRDRLKRGLRRQLPNQGTLAKSDFARMFEESLRLFFVTSYGGHREHLMFVADDLFPGVDSIPLPVDLIFSGFQVDVQIEATVAAGMVR
jgi:transcriptional regulator with XRE-family HTH domain